MLGEEGSVIGNVRGSVSEGKMWGDEEGVNKRECGVTYG